MLCLSRKTNEVIRIGDHIKIMVIEIRGDKVRLGIEAPQDVRVHREEVYDAIKRESAAASAADGNAKASDASGTLGGSEGKSA